MKDLFKIILAFLPLLIFILFQIFKDVEWINFSCKILSIIYCLLLCFIGGYLIFRCIKPKMKKSEIENEDIKDIKLDWYGWSKGEEPSIDYVYMKACQYERIRIYTKIGLFLLGLIIICFGLGLLNEVINWK